MILDKIRVNMSRLLIYPAKTLRLFGKGQDSEQFITISEFIVVREYWA